MGQPELNCLSPDQQRGVGWVEGKYIKIAIQYATILIERVWVDEKGGYEEHAILASQVRMASELR
jgi:hypothetical protein